MSMGDCANDKNQLLRGSLIRITRITAGITWGLRGRLRDYGGDYGDTLLNPPHSRFRLGPALLGKGLAPMAL